MISRRNMLSGTTVGGMLASLGSLAGIDAAGTDAAGLEAAGEPAMQADNSAAIQTVARAVTSLKDEVRRQTSFWELEAVRIPIRTFLRNTGKYPEYIEVGTDIWQQIYDWHIRVQQPFTVARTSEGRYTILMQATLCIMRTELPGDYIGAPYDSR